MSMTVADRLVARLEQWDVRIVFGLPGDGINGLYEAFRKREKVIRLIQVRHEEAAALAACAYAKFTQRLGVCLATSGPGGVHLLNGLYDAKFDGQPVLAITGHTFHDLIGTRYQQDLDLDKLFMDVAAYSVRVMSPSHVVNVVDQAVKTAIARRTVTHLTIPKDVQSWTAEDERSPVNIESHSGGIYTDPQPLPPQAKLEHATEVIRSGSKIAILAGRGCLDAREEIHHLARLLKAPIVKALLGKAVVPDDDPYTTGGVGLLGTRHLHKRCSEPVTHSSLLEAVSPISSSIRSRGRLAPFKSIWMPPELASATPSQWDWSESAETSFEPGCP